MSRAAVAADVIRALEMSGLARSFEALNRQAREERWTVEEYLGEVLAAELTSREASAVRLQLHAARFPAILATHGRSFRLRRPREVVSRPGAPPPQDDAGRPP